MRLKRSDTVGHVDLNRSFRRSSFSHEERILRRNLPPASFCENFVLAIFRLFQQNRPEAEELILSRTSALVRRQPTWLRYPRTSPSGQERTLAPPRGKLKPGAFAVLWPSIMISAGPKIQ